MVRKPFSLCTSSCIRCNFPPRHHSRTEISWFCLIVLATWTMEPYPYFKEGRVLQKRTKWHSPALWMCPTWTELWHGGGGGLVVEVGGTNWTRRSVTRELWGLTQVTWSLTTAQVPIYGTCRNSHLTRLLLWISTIKVVKLFVKRKVLKIGHNRIHTHKNRS